MCVVKQVPVVPAPAAPALVGPAPEVAAGGAPAVAVRTIIISHCKVLIAFALFQLLS
jgi:hypothetical protein